MVSVPSHLATWAVPEEIPTDEYISQIALRCPCGNNRLQILHPGAVQECRGQVYPGMLEVDGRQYFLVAAKCVACGNSLLIFDNDLHGWTGVIQRDQERASAPRPPLQAWQCFRCGAAEHRGAVRYTLPGESDFEYGLRGEFKNRIHADFPNAAREDVFVWIGMDLWCCACGLFTWLWFEAETM
jgi:hypothetical protein